MAKKAKAAKGSRVKSAKASKSKAKSSRRRAIAPPQPRKVRETPLANIRTFYEVIEQTTAIRAKQMKDLLLFHHGLHEDDDRLKLILAELEDNQKLNATDISDVRSRCELIDRALDDRLIIPEFGKFMESIEDIYEKVLPIQAGEVADYIPQLKNVNPENFGVYVCTIDGQRNGFGDWDTRFNVTCCSKVISYAIAQHLNGPQKVHEYIGKEPSGRPFDEPCLDERAHVDDLRARRDALKAAAKIEDPDERFVEELRIRGMPLSACVPHNPYISAGAIMVQALVLPNETQSTRFEYIMDIWARLCGANPKSKSLRPPTFCNGAYLAERANNDSNMCLAHMMRAKQTCNFPDGADLQKTVDTYLMCGAIECTAATLSVVAATLANGGVCPVTQDRIFDAAIVTNCLSVMGTCGMYDYSGEFAHTIGFPAKSGRGGALLIVIPGVMGICTWSPRLDSLNNSVRGVAFCHELDKRFLFHTFDTVSSSDGKKGESKKIDPRRDDLVTSHDDDITALLWAAAQGDLIRSRQLLGRKDMNINDHDYDLRSALHLAASEGHVELVKYFIGMGANLERQDRFGNTPLDDARRHGHKEAVTILENSTQVKPTEQGVNSVARLSIRALRTPPTVEVTKEEVWSALADVGFSREDNRLKPIIEGLPDGPLSETSMNALRKSEVIRQGLEGRCILQDLSTLRRMVHTCYEDASKNTSGHVAGYIPELARVNPEQFGVSVCSIHGQCVNEGDVDVEFGVQSCSKPITYAMALELHGPQKVFEHVGREPSGRPFNEPILDMRRHERGDGVPVPHNPLINAGAIMSIALLMNGQADVDKTMAGVLQKWSDLAGGRDTTYDHAMFEGEKSTADRNKCLAYMMQEYNSFIEGTDAMASLDCYFKCCSILQDCKSMAMIASTLANGGVCPATNKRVFKAETVRAVLSLMFSCGMYDYSGEFAFTMGIPSKSGVAGALLIVIPNVCGICTWSPRLDGNGNSVRGIEFCRRLGQIYQIHNYEKLPGVSMRKMDLRLPYGAERRAVCNLVVRAASQGDIMTLSALYSLGGVDVLNMADYDGRTALHLACAEGKARLLQYMLSKPGLIATPVDRWGETPLSDATNNQACLNILTTFVETGKVAKPKRRSSARPWSPKKTLSSASLDSRQKLRPVLARAASSAGRSFSSRPFSPAQYGSV